VGRGKRKSILERILGERGVIFVTFRDSRQRPRNASSLELEEKSRRGENTELGFDPFRARDTLNRTVWVKVMPRVASMCSRTRSHETSA